VRSWSSGGSGCNWRLRLIEGELRTDEALRLQAELRPVDERPPGIFVRGRVYGNPQEFFGKRNFALLVVGYRSLFGIVRESFFSPGRLPLSPAALAGLF
jgi:hypothetical protein